MQKLAYPETRSLPKESCAGEGNHAEVLREALASFRLRGVGQSDDGVGHIDPDNFQI